MRLAHFGLLAITLGLAPIAMAAGAGEGLAFNDLVLPLVLTVIGLFLLIMEATVIPGFGIAGVTGVLVLAAGLFLGIRDLSVHVLDLTEGGVAAISSGIIGSLVGCTGVSIGFIKIFPHLPGAKRLIHDGSVGDSPSDSDSKYEHLVGASGVARTDLRPAGKVRVGSEDLDVTTNEGWINAGDQIVVEKIHEGHLIVRRVV